MRTEQLIAGIRTVTHLAPYFDELKSRARQLAGQISPSARGYFTPDEDAETQGLFVSYWQSRRALIDLIESFRQDETLDEELRRAAFLTALAAALVLIDGARFLRDTVDAVPLVRRKLNHALPQFGLGDQLYDQVQKSLVSVRNTWHLYHAAQYFTSHEAELRAAAAHEPLAGVMRIIDRNSHHLQVPAAQLARARIRTRARQIASKLARGALWRPLYGLQKLAGTLLADRYARRGHRPSLPPEVDRQLRSLLRPGDVLVVRKEHAITNYFLPGYWPHAALFLGDATELAELGVDRDPRARPRWARLLEPTTDGETRRVIESMRDGVWIRSVGSPLASDSVLVLRPGMAPSEIAVGLARAFEHEGKPYDFDFDFRRSDRMVCTEVVYRAYDGVGGMRFPLIQRAGRPTLSGSDLVDFALEGRLFEPVALFAPAHAPVLATGASVAPLIRKCRSRPGEI